jgi:hypothetical protein
MIHFHSFHHKKLYYENLFNILYGFNNRNTTIFLDGNPFNLNSDNIYFLK